MSVVSFAGATGKSEILARLRKELQDDFFALMYSEVIQELKIE